MDSNTLDFLNIKDEMEKTKNELYYLLEISKQNVESIKDTDDFNLLKNEIGSLKKEIKVIKEINSKTIDFLLLKIESSSDKLKQDYGYSTGYPLNSDVMEHNPDYEEKKYVNDFSEYDARKLRDIISSKDEEIAMLRNNVNLLNKEIGQNLEFIEKLSVDSENFDDCIIWKNKFDIITKELHEKNATIQSLKEENNVLKNIIDEKDKTINFLKR